METAMSKLTLASASVKLLVGKYKKKCWNTHDNVTLLGLLRCKITRWKKSKRLVTKHHYGMKIKPFNNKNQKWLQGFWFHNFGFISNSHFFSFRHCCAKLWKQKERKIGSKRENNCLFMEALDNAKYCLCDKQFYFFLSVKRCCLFSPRYHRICLLHDFSYFFATTDNSEKFIGDNEGMNKFWRQ